MCQRGYVLASDSPSAADCPYDHTLPQHAMCRQFYINTINVISKKPDSLRFLGITFSTNCVLFSWNPRVISWQNDLSNNSPEHLQQISCSMLSFHCSVSDVQGETDGKPHTVFPFAWAHHEAVRQLGPHVTRAISNVACLYGHATSIAVGVWWLVVISLSVRSERISVLPLALVYQLRPNNQLCQWTWRKQMLILKVE